MHQTQSRCEMSFHHRFKCSQYKTMPTSAITLMIDANDWLLARVSQLEIENKILCNRYLHFKPELVKWKMERIQCNILRVFPEKKNYKEICLSMKISNHNHFFLSESV